jgi:MFS family permease
MKKYAHKDIIRKSLKYSVTDGGFHAAMLGCGESFFVAFAVFLKASNIQIGLLGSLPLLIGSLSQLLANTCIRFMKSRKSLVSSAALSQALMHIPIVLVFFFGQFRVPLLIVFVCVYYVFGMILGPAWNSWMGELVDEKKRGSYFGRRSKITGSSTFAATLLAGYILHMFTNGTHSQYAGFVLIFMLAAAFRITSFAFLKKKYEPPYEVPPRNEFGFVEFIREARHRNYGKFVLYLCFMNFSVYLAAPFFVPYMLKDLHFDYLMFTIINAAAIVTKFLSMPVWGKASDQFGTRKILALTGYLMPLVPVLWVFSGNVFYLITIQVYSGFIWAGFELASFNFVFDTTTPQKRATSVAYYNVLNGMCIFAGAVIGGLMVKYNNLFWSKYFFVFILSCIMRYAVSYVFIPKLREVRAVDAIPYSRLFFKIVSTMPTIGPVYNLIPFRRKTTNKQ